MTLTFTQEQATAQGLPKQIVALREEVLSSRDARFDRIEARERDLKGKLEEYKGEDGGEVGRHGWIAKGDRGGDD